MRDCDLYARILGIKSPWGISDVVLDHKERCVEICLQYSEQLAPCPVCGNLSPKHDTKERTWRHLDTCQFETHLRAKVPRIVCVDDGVLQISVPWAEPNSRFTAMFEALAIDWMKEASLSGVARLLRVSWDEADGIRTRAVNRGLERRTEELPAALAVDETGFGRGHDYVTVISDRVAGTVSDVADGRKKEVLVEYFRKFTREELAGIDTITMDMWEGFISATRDEVPDADEKIAFDRFHVAQHLGHAVDEVRRAEARVQYGLGDRSMRGSRYSWLMNPENMDTQRREAFEKLKATCNKTSRAWAIKDAATRLWDFNVREEAAEAWAKWYGWAIRSRLEPIKQVARMVKSHLDGILNAVVTGATNASAESVNSKIQWIKYMARGFRNRERFREAILFHLGGLDLYPANARFLPE